MRCHTLAGDQLRRTLRKSAERAGCLITFVSEESRAWRSATFEGGKHRFVISGTGAGDRFETWVRSVAVDHPVLRGYLVADVTIDALTRHGRGGRTKIATIEALTVVDA